MDIKTYLAEQGLNEDQIAVIVGNEATAKAMTSALSKYEEGTAAATRAAAELEAAKGEREEATKFWEEKVTPALATVDKKVATATSEAARYKAYLQSLKDGGYDVPDELLKGATAEPPRPQFVTREDMGKEFSATAPTLVSLMALSNEYQDLFGAPYLAGETDFAEAQKARKPLRDFVRDKYKFEAKRQERNQASEQKRIDAIVAERVKAEEAKLAEKYGSNPDLRTAMPSKFDKIEKMAGDRKDAWKTSKGREESRKDRLNKFQNVTLQ